MWRRLLDSGRGIGQSARGEPALAPTDTSAEGKLSSVQR
jgi:hypothetical protein